jgi:hypothetical protein
MQVGPKRQITIVIDWQIVGLNTVLFLIIMLAYPLLY